mmetsp:Transcript_9898/g.15870  ORF Transcript_9898/g.15870 Transcript_9898/m.15870 type:complete len:269 (-) Transcript_9898:716-1522(-)
MHHNLVQLVQQSEARIDHFESFIDIQVFANAIKLVEEHIVFIKVFRSIKHIGPQVQLRSGNEETPHTFDNGVCIQSNGSLQRHLFGDIRVELDVFVHSVFEYVEFGRLRNAKRHRQFLHHEDAAHRLPIHQRVDKTLIGRRRLHRSHCGSRCFLVFFQMMMLQFLFCVEVHLTQLLLHFHHLCLRLDIERVDVLCIGDVFLHVVVPVFNIILIEAVEQRQRHRMVLHLEVGTKLIAKLVFLRQDTRRDLLRWILILERVQQRDEARAL